MFDCLKIQFNTSLMFASIININFNYIRQFEIDFKYRLRREKFSVRVKR